MKECFINKVINVHVGPLLLIQQDNGKYSQINYCQITVLEIFFARSSSIYIDLHVPYLFMYDAFMYDLYILFTTKKRENRLPEHIKILISQAKISNISSWLYSRIVLSKKFNMDCSKECFSMQQHFG